MKCRDMVLGLFIKSKKWSTIKKNQRILEFLGSKLIAVRFFSEKNESRKIPCISSLLKTKEALHICHPRLQRKEVWLIFSSRWRKYLLQSRVSSSLASLVKLWKRWVDWAMGVLVSNRRKSSIPWSINFKFI